MPPRRLTRQEQKAQTRARLLLAAEAVFGDRGFFAASVEEVAERAGFTVGAVYSNFDTKADLFVAMFKEQVAREMHEYLALVARHETAEAQARAGAERWLRYLRQNPGYLPMFLEFAAHAAREPRLLAPLAEILATAQETFATMVASSAGGAGLRLSPEGAQRMGVVVNALGTGLALTRMADPRAVPDELFGDALALLFEAGLARIRTAATGPERV